VRKREKKEKQGAALRLWATATAAPMILISDITLTFLGK